MALRASERLVVVTSVKDEPMIARGSHLQLPSNYDLLARLHSTMQDQRIIYDPVKVLTSPEFKLIPPGTKVDRDEAIVSSRPLCLLLAWHRV